MSLFEPIRDVDHTVYCGPNAITLLTGVPVSRAEYMLRRCRRRAGRDSLGRKLPIKGTYPWEVIKVLKRLGCKVTPIAQFEPTFGRFCKDTKHLKANYLVEVTHHWIAVSHQGLTEEQHARREADRRIMRKVWRVDAPAVPKYTIDDPIGRKPRPPKPKPDIKELRYRETLARLKKWGIRAKRAKTAIKKLTARKRYYEKLLATVTVAAEQQPDSHEQSQQREVQQHLLVG